MLYKFCKAVRSLSFKVWELLAESQYYGLYRTSKNVQRGLSISEETITDILLLDLSKKYPLGAITVKFSKNYEAHEGADWELWILSRGKALGIRLQAKKLHFSGRSYIYSYLDYRYKSGDLQVEKLINLALSKNLIPLYVFYNFWDLSLDYRRYLNRHIPICCRINTPKNLGVAIASAFDVRNLINNGQKKLEDVLGVSFPIHCIGCCVFSDMVDSVSKFFKGYVLGERKEVVESAIKDKLPDEVLERFIGEIPRDSVDKEVPMYTTLIFDLENPPEYIDKFDTRGLLDLY